MFLLQLVACFDEHVAEDKVSVYVVSTELGTKRSHRHLQVHLVAQVVNKRGDMLKKNLEYWNRRVREALAPSGLSSKLEVRLILVDDVLHHRSYCLKDRGQSHNRLSVYGCGDEDLDACLEMYLDKAGNNPFSGD